MKEVALQGLVVDLVNEHGGYARKLSHKFLVGISDLLVKMPEYPAIKIEVKQRICQPNVDREFELTDLTVLQKRDLLEAQAAGMNCGVLSFVQTKNGLTTLHGAIYPILPLQEAGYKINVRDHRSLIKPASRTLGILSMIAELSTWQR